jgi:hypothetical protein
MTRPADETLVAVCLHRNDFAEPSADPTAGCWSFVRPMQLRENTRGVEPDQSTAFRIGWDAHDLRVLFECQDTHIVATRTNRDEPLYEEEVVEVFLDPVGDGAGYFEFELNPLNAVLDLTLRRTGAGWRKDVRWNCEGLRTAIKRTGAGWNAELAIPLRNISVDPVRPGVTWRANFFRIDRPDSKPRELSAWSPTLHGTFHDPQAFGAIRFE